MKMLDNKTFTKRFLLLSENFGFEASPEYQAMVFTSLKDQITTDQFLEGTTWQILNVKAEEWNKAYSYRGKPTIADWVSALVPPEQWIEQEQNYKCSITGANLVRRVMVKVSDQLKIEKE
jgi:hypothetical protein